MPRLCCDTHSKPGHHRATTPHQQQQRCCNRVPTAPIANDCRAKSHKESSHRHGATRRWHRSGATPDDKLTRTDKEARGGGSGTGAEPHPMTNSPGQTRRHEEVAVAQERRHTRRQTHPDSQSRGKPPRRPPPGALPCPASRRRRRSPRRRRSGAPVAAAACGRCRRCLQQ